MHKVFILKKYLNNKRYLDKKGWRIRFFYHIPQAYQSSDAVNEQVRETQS